MLIAFAMLAAACQEQAPCGPECDEMTTETGGGTLGTGGGTTSTTETPTTTGGTTTTTVPVTTTTIPALPGLEGGVEGFDAVQASWNAFWMSRVATRSLVLESGLGIAFTPDAGAVSAMAESVGLDGDSLPPTLPSMALVLQATFADGDTTLDVGGEGWAPAVSNEVTLGSQAAAISLSTAWARILNDGEWAGPATAAEGGAERLEGVVMFTAALAQADYALVNLRDSSGRFIGAAQIDPDGSIDITEAAPALADQYLMLAALSDLVAVLRQPDAYNGVYPDGFRDWIGPGADDLFDQVADADPDDIEESSLAVRGVARYLAAGPDEERRTAAVAVLASVAGDLHDATPSGPVERARAIVGLVEAGLALEDDSLITEALADFETLYGRYRPESGSFMSVTELEASEVGDILEALHLVRKHSPDPEASALAAAMLGGFFQAGVGMSGLAPAMPAPAETATSFELDKMPAESFFAYPIIPEVTEVAPVPFGRITFDADLGWERDGGDFETSAASRMILALLTMSDAANGGPVSDEPTDQGDGGSSTTTTTAPAGGGTSAIEVATTEFAFSPFDLVAAPGSEVTLTLRNDGVVLHNLDIPDLGVFVEAEPGQTVEVTFSAPAAGSYAFICNLPGHREAGMEGTLEISP